MNPKDPRAFSNRALCHIHLGAFPQGLEDAEKCIELEPTFLKGYVRKAKVQFLMENYENALETYLEGLKCDPNNLEVLDGLRRCAACVKGSNAGDVELEDLKYVEIEELKHFMPGDGPNTGHQQRSNGVPASRVVTSQCECNTKDIDESSAERLYDAMSYAMANMMLIQVQVLGTTKEFWRLSDKATRISRKLALILRSHHSVGKYLTAPLQVSNIWIGSNGIVKLRGVSFTSKGFSTERVRDDYKRLSRILTALITISGGDSTKLPPDYAEFLLLLESDTLKMKDEFLIVNNAALLPIRNRTEVFLMLHDRIVDYLGCTNKKKKKKILSSLPYKEDWLDTAKANTKINQWVVNVQNEYKMTPHDLLRLNRNIRSHLHRYKDGDDIEEVLYCEWPELLMVMQKMLHLEGELEATEIQNKFG